MVSSSGWTVEIMLLCIIASHMSPPTNLEESSQSLGQLLHTVLQIVDKGPAESSSFAVESLVRTFDLEQADAFVYEVISKEVLGDGSLLEIFGELGVGEALLQHGELVRLEPLRELVVRYVPVLVSSSLWYILQVLKQWTFSHFYPHECRHCWTFPEEVKGPDSP